MGKAGKDSSVHRSGDCGRAGQQTENGERGKQARLHDVPCYGFATAEVVGLLAA
jgi:hypothetical protein